MKRFVAALLFVLLITAQVVEGLHHHSDGVDHDDCPICAAACLRSSDVLSAPPLLPERIEITVAIPPLPINDLVCETFTGSVNTRAPPA